MRGAKPVREGKPVTPVFPSDNARARGPESILAPAGAALPSFASADELREILWLETGAVTPLALLNAPDVTLYLDEALLGSRIAVHPNTNTATVWLQTADLVNLLRTQCVPVVAVPFPCLA